MRGPCRDRTTPQYRTALLRKLRNLFPDCTVEFTRGGHGDWQFQLFDRDGRPRSGPRSPSSLTTSDILAVVADPGGSDAGPTG